MIVLFYILVQSLAFLIIQKCKKSNRLGIEIINQMSTLEKLLNDILVIVQNKDDIENSDSKKSQIIAQSIIDILKKKNEVSVKIDKNVKFITESTSSQSIELVKVNRSSIDK